MIALMEMKRAPVFIFPNFSFVRAFIHGFFIKIYLFPRRLAYLLQYYCAVELILVTFIYLSRRTFFPLESIIIP